MTVLAAGVGPSAYWYVARATGAVALLLLTVCVVLGILGSIRFSAAPRWPRFAIDGLHRDTSLLVIALLVVHVATSVLDGFAPISLIDGVLPFRSPYRPLWLGLGTVSFDLLLALVATSLLRRRLGYRSWRAIHWLAYASWPVAVLHGLGTGSDVKSWWMLVLTAACTAAVVVAVFTRIGRAASADDGIRAGAAAASLAMVLGLVIFTVAGPLQRGWARRAGTPLRLLGATHLVSVRASQGVPASTVAAGPLDRQFTATLRGSVSQQDAGGGAIVQLSLQLGGGEQGQMRIRLGGSPLPSGGLSLTGSQVDLTAPGMPSAMTGQIVTLEGTQFLARVSDVSGSVVDLRGALKINGSAVTGSLAGSPVGDGR